jgi:putative ABC transport system substrate-binding protein
LRRRDLIILLGGATVGAAKAFAQQKAMPMIGYLHSGVPDPTAPFLAAFRQGLSETGYVEGQNLAIEYRWAEGHYDRLPVLAADLVGRKVDVIAAIGDNVSALAAKKATSTIPLVFIVGTDPVEDGLVASIARPGGNLTGVSLMRVELIAKRLELPFELVPQVGLFALLVNPDNATAEPVIRAVQEAARTKGVQLLILKANTESEFDTAFAALVQRQAGALVVGGDPFFNSRRAALVALASHHAVPAIYASREFAASGGLISYGASLAAAYRQAGIYAGKILKGAKPADLPVQQPSKFELVINLKTSKALGLTIPQSFLARADEVIESSGNQPQTEIAARSRGLVERQPKLADHLFAHREFLDLAGHRHREIGDEFDVARDLVMGDLAVAKGAHLLDRRHLAVAQPDPGA